jgi:hypothetical protein
MLIHMISLTFQSIMNVTIKNQCTDIKLVSPVYFTKDATHHIQVPQQVNIHRIMKTNFTTGTDQNTFGGALLYRLQEHISTITQLLVIWGYESDRIYSHTWLIEHESTLAWDKDKLKRLYHAYNSQYDGRFNTEEWIMNHSEKLKIISELSHGGFEVEIIISEYNTSLSSRIPPWIDSNR